MIKQLLFDFDGVIMDSVPLKGEGFRYIFRKFPTKAQNELLNYHQVNGGVSRYDKIRYFFSDIVKQGFSEDDVQAYAAEFSQFITAQLYKSDLIITEVVQFIQQNYQRYDMAIVSASDQEELRGICRHHGFDQYFFDILGSPKLKKDNIASVLLQHDYAKQATALIGDSPADKAAADANHIHFIGFNNAELKQQTPRYLAPGSFCELGALLEALN